MSNIENEQRQFEIWESMRQQSLEELHKALLSNDDDYRHTAAMEVQCRGERATFVFIENLSTSQKSSQREIAAFVMGQLGTPDRPFVSESTPILRELLRNDPESKVRAAAAAALGHLHASDAFDELCIAASDQSVDVRLSIAFALGQFAQDKRAIVTLLTLTHDKDPGVVTWAVLGLRLLDINSVEILDRFVELLSDESIDKDTLDEAICGLSQWKEIRVLPKLLEQLNLNNINLDLVSAAGDLGHRAVLPRLIELRNEWCDDVPKCLEDAISILSA